MTGFTGLFSQEAVSGNRWGELEKLSLSAHLFWRFGDTIGAMFDAGCAPVEADWESVIFSGTRPMQVGTSKRFKTHSVDQSTPTVSSALKMWAKGPGPGPEVDAEEEDVCGSLTNLSFNLELLREAVEGVYLRAKQQAKHQGLEAEVLGNQILAKSGVFIDPYESEWDAISTLYGKQTQLEEGLEDVVDQFISHRLSALAVTLENYI
jgi:hypothetical protein